MRYRTAKRIGNALYIFFIASVLYTGYKWYPLINAKMCPTTELMTLRNFSIIVGIVAIAYDLLKNHLIKKAYKIVNLYIDEKPSDKSMDTKIRLEQDERCTIHAYKKFFIDGERVNGSVEVLAFEDCTIEIKKLNGRIIKNT